MPVTAEELHQAFWDTKVGIAEAHSAWVDDNLREFEGDQYACVDGEVNFSRLAEWINARMGEE